MKNFCSTLFATLVRNHTNYRDSIVSQVHGKSAVIKYLQLLSKVISINGVLTQISPLHHLKQNGQVFQDKHVVQILLHVYDFTSKSIQNMHNFIANMLRMYKRLLNSFQSDTIPIVRTGHHLRLKVLGQTISDITCMQKYTNCCLFRNHGECSYTRLKLIQTRAEDKSQITCCPPDSIHHTHYSQWQFMPSGRWHMM